VVGWWYGGEYRKQPRIVLRSGKRIFRKTHGKYKVYQIESKS
jgi:hypothetical protein